MDDMLERMPARQFREWQEFDLWEMEMNQRATLQAKADASVTAMKAGR